MINITCKHADITYAKKKKKKLEKHANVHSGKKEKNSTKNKKNQTITKWASLTTYKWTIKLILVENNE